MSDEEAQLVDDHRDPRAHHKLVLALLKRLTRVDTLQFLLVQLGQVLLPPPANNGTTDAVEADSTVANTRKQALLVEDQFDTLARY